MDNEYRQEFGTMMAAIYAFYGKECTSAALGIWWAALKPYDYIAVRDAIGRHSINPDSGQFLPKPADVVRMLGGSTLDTALIALSKVEGAVSSVGNYMTVVFDDPLIHRVIEEMGGWPEVCLTKARDWEFRRNEFLNRYRSYRSRSETPAYAPRLIGTLDSQNSAAGFRVDNENVRLIGDAKQAIAVMKGGSETARIGMQRMLPAMLQLESKTGTS